MGGLSWSSQSLEEQATRRACVPPPQDLEQWPQGPVRQPEAAAATALEEHEQARSPAGRSPAHADSSTGWPPSLATHSTVRCCVPCAWGAPCETGSKTIGLGGEQSWLGVSVTVWVPTALQMAPAEQAVHSPAIQVAQRAW